MLLWIIAAILIVLWLLGLITSYTLGGFIHLFIIAAVIVLLVRAIRGPRVLSGRRETMGETPKSTKRKVK